jgi:hypothetical protein
MNRRAIVAGCLLAALLAAGCAEDPDAPGGGGGGGAVSGSESGPASSAGVESVAADGGGADYTGPHVFTDVTSVAGIGFRHNNGAFGKKYLPETMGGGAAFLDYDGDGWQDLFFVNSTSWPEKKSGPSYPALYRNNRDGTFADVTREAGLAVDLYGLGAAAADYDADGDTDLYVTALGPNRLFRNDGGKFSDATGSAKVGDPGFSTSAAFFDYDKDGKLDLFVCNYVEWTPENDVRCSLDGTNKSYCTPELYKGQSPTLYRNKGNGTFDNVTDRAGLRDPDCKALGVALVDFDENGWMDLFVANDTQPNRLYKNNGNGTFVDVAIEAGVAFSDAGMPRAGMGIDAGDFDGSGKWGFVLGNFVNEMMSLYRNEGGGLFTDIARSTEIGQGSAQSVTFACYFFDADNDGDLDVFGVNGHVSDDIGKVQPQTKYAQPAHLFRNEGGGKFTNASGAMGAAIAKAVVGRGSAYSDYDRDGDLDVVVCENNGPARLLRNDGGSRNGSVRVTLAGAGTNRDAIGAVVTVATPSGASLRRMVKTGSSYCSQSELPLTFGLGSDAKAASVRVAWPSGRVEEFPEIGANQSVVIQEGVGIVATEPLSRR